MKKKMKHLKKNKNKENFNSNPETRKLQAETESESPVKLKLIHNSTVQEKEHLDVSKLVEKDFSNRHIIP